QSLHRAFPLSVRSHTEPRAHDVVGAPRRGSTKRAGSPRGCSRLASCAAPSEAPEDQHTDDRENPDGGDRGRGPIQTSDWRRSDLDGLIEARVFVPRDGHLGLDGPRSGPVKYERAAPALLTSDLSEWHERRAAVG